MAGSEFSGKMPRQSGRQPKNDDVHDEFGSERIVNDKDADVEVDCRSRQPKPNENASAVNRVEVAAFIDQARYKNKNEK
jgi:hypothetical protein